MDNTGIGFLIVILALIAGLAVSQYESPPRYSGSVFLTPMTPEDICKKLPDNVLCK